MIKIFLPKKLKISAPKLNPSEAGASYNLPKGAQITPCMWARFLFDLLSRFRRTPTPVPRFGRRPGRTPSPCTGTSSGHLSFKSTTMCRPPTTPSTKRRGLPPTGKLKSTFQGEFQPLGFLNGIILSPIVVIFIDLNSRLSNLKSLILLN